MRTYNQTSTEVEQKVVGLYNSGKSSVYISKELNTNPTTVLQIVRRYGFPTRTTRQTSKRYIFNEDFFERIDTEEKAYWLGFILADGCVSRGKDLKIILKSSDKYHLNKFIRSLDGDNKYQMIISHGFGGNFPQASLSIRSKKICNDLKLQNITENKSLTVTPPKVSTNLCRHFWRGVVDGDGHICICQSRGHKYIEIGLCGSESVIQGFIDYVKSEIGLTITLAPDHNIWRARTTGKRALKLCSLLYDNSTVSLNRKSEIYNNYKENVQNANNK